MVFFFFFFRVKMLFLRNTSKFQGFQGFFKNIFWFLVCFSSQSCLVHCEPLDYSPSTSSVHGGSSGKNTGVGCQDTLLVALSEQMDCLLSKPPGKPREYQSEWPIASPEHPPKPEINLGSPAWHQILKQVTYQGSAGFC